MFIYSNLIIYYFSGTGNAKNAAEWIGNIAMTKKIKFGEKKILNNFILIQICMKYLKFKLNDSIGTITFNDDDRRNCLSTALLEELLICFDKLNQKDSRVVIIRANTGSKVWSSGFNIKELPHPGNDPLSYNNALEKALRAIQEFPAPVIAMIEGSVWGGACELAFTSDILIGTPTATFAITPAKIGVPYNSSGIIHFLNIVGINIAKEMFFTAQPISAAKAENLGILNHLVTTDELEEFTFNMAKQISSNSPLSIRVVKKQINTLAAADPLTPDTFEMIQDLRREAYESEDYLEGLKAFIQKRPARFTGK